MADGHLRSRHRRPYGRGGGCGRQGEGGTAQGVRSLGSVLGLDAPSLASGLPWPRLSGHAVVALANGPHSRSRRVLLLYSARLLKPIPYLIDAVFIIILSFCVCVCVLD